MEGNFRKYRTLTRKDAVGIGELMPYVLRAMKLSAGMNTHRVFAAWDEVSGVAAFTLNRFYKDGTLHITVSSSMVRTQLKLRTKQIIDAMNSRLAEDELFMKDNQVGFVKKIILR